MSSSYPVVPPRLRSPNARVVASNHRVPCEECHHVPYYAPALPDDEVPVVTFPSDRVPRYDFSRWGKIDYPLRDYPEEAIDLNQVSRDFSIGKITWVYPESAFKDLEARVAKLEEKIK
jgi:hypothetical protein